MPKETIRTMTKEEFHARQLEHLKELSEQFSRKPKSWNELPETSRRGFIPTQWNGKEYLVRNSTNFTETVLLDEEGRKSEYWQNWDHQTQRVRHTYTYDDDGFITSESTQKGNGYGYTYAVSYYEINGQTQYTKEGNKIPEILTIEHYSGDTQFAFRNRVMGRGKNDGDILRINVFDHLGEPQD